MTNFKHFLAYGAVLSLFGVVGFIFGALNSDTFATKRPERQVASVSAALPTPLSITEADVDGKAAYVFDIANNTGVFAKNAESQLPLASVTKVPVVLLAKRHLRDDGVITLTQEMLAPEGESGFEVGESWVVHDLIDFTLMTSSNDGAAALATAVERATNTDIAVLLNQLAQELGLSQTYFLNETGLDNGSISRSGAYGSARDMAALFTYAYKTAPDTFAATVAPTHTFTNADGKEYEAVNTNKALSDLPGLVFGKTGFTDLAGGNLVVVTESEPGHPFVTVVLGSTVEARFADAIALVHATLPEVEN